MKKTKFLPAIIALAAALLSLPALAQSTPDSGFYFGFGGGHSDAKDACKAGPPCGGAGTNWDLFGGWQFNRILSVEVGIRDLGQSLAAGEDWDSGEIEISGLAGVPIGPVYLYGKGGVFRGEMASGNKKESNVNFTVGAGVQVDLSHAFAVRAEWQRYRQLGGRTPGFFKTDIDTVTAAVVFKFR